MPVKLSDKDAQEALNLLARYGTCHQAAMASGMPASSIRVRVKAAERRGLTPDPDIVPEDELKVSALEYKVKSLQAQLKRVELEELGAREIRKTIFKIADLEPVPPEWVIKPPAKPNKGPGVPTLLLSDLHWGEVVASSELPVDNEYNMRIAKTRLRQVIHNTIEVLHKHMVVPKYDGLVIAMGGDMFSGNIHDLNETNDKPLMLAFLDLLGCIVWSIDELLKWFPNLYIVGVSGNHSRNTFRPTFKQRNYSNFDWLLYQMLQRHYVPAEGPVDKRIAFNIPDGADASYSVLGHDYLLTHGDQFRSGDSIIGPIGPVLRGLQKKKNRQSQVGKPFTTMLLGHWHQLTFLGQRCIINGSLCGYNEFASFHNMPFEPPQQALWLTNADRGITMQLPIHATTKVQGKKSEWVTDG